MGSVETSEATSGAGKCSLADSDDLNSPTPLAFGESTLPMKGREEELSQL